MKQVNTLPQELFIDMESKSLEVTPALQEALPGVTHAFAEVDAAYKKNPDKYFRCCKPACFHLITAMVGLMLRFCRARVAGL